MSYAILALGFTTGLVTSLHCLGMCGPLVLAVGCAGGEPGLKSWAWRSLGWNVGRGIGLVAAGLAIGTAGSFLPVGRSAAVLSIVAGTLTLIVALALPGWLPMPKALRVRVEAFGSRVLGRLLARPGVSGAFLVGLGTLLLPCGPVYGVYAQAAALGTLGGGSLLLAFWSGTVPALVALAAGAGAVGPRLRRWALPVASATLALAGCALVFRGVRFLVLFTGAKTGHSCCH